MSEIKVTMVLEVLGRPVEHISQVLNEIIERLEKEKGVKILDKKIFPPKAIEQLFSTFCEIEISIETLYRLFEICSEYLPSSVEITEPGEMSMKLQDSNAIINYLLAKLHKYEEIIHIINAEREIMFNQLNTRGEKPAFLPMIEQQNQQKEKQNKKSNKTVKSSKNKKGRKK